MRRLRLAIGMMAVAALLGACGGDDEEATSPAAHQTATATATAAPDSGEPVVDMNDELKFVPDSITVSPGQRVEWRNVGKIAHTVTSTPSKVADPANVEVPKGAKDFDSGLIGEDENYEHTFTEPGTYRYVCLPHEGAAMVGTVVVKG